MKPKAILVTLSLFSVFVFQGCAKQQASEPRLRAQTPNQVSSENEAKTVQSQVAADPIEKLVGYWKSDDSKREGYLVIYGNYNAKTNQNDYYVRGIDPSWIVMDAITTVDFEVPLKAVDENIYAGVFEEKPFSESVFKIKVKLKVPKGKSEGLKVDLELRDYRPSASEKNNWILVFNSSGNFSAMTDAEFGNAEPDSLVRFLAKRTQGYFEAGKKKNNSSSKCNYGLSDAVKRSDYACVEDHFKKKAAVDESELRALLSTAIVLRDVRLAKLILNRFKDGQNMNLQALVEAVKTYSELKTANSDLDSFYLTGNRFTNPALLEMLMIDMLVNERGADFSAISKSKNEKERAELIHGVFVAKNLSRYAPLISIGFKSGLNLSKSKYKGSLAFIDFFFDYMQWGSERLNLAKSLFDAGADVNALLEDASGGVVSRAAVYGDVELLKLLKERGADFTKIGGEMNLVQLIEKSISNNEIELKKIYNQSISMQRALNATHKRLNENLEFVKSLQ